MTLASHDFVNIELILQCLRYLDKNFLLNSSLFICFCLFYMPVFFPHENTDFPFSIKVAPYSVLPIGPCAQKIVANTLSAMKPLS